MMSKKALTKSKATKQKKAIEISEAMRKRLREHAKVHQGGMSGKHMRNMVRFIKAGDNFRMAHEKAVKLDMEEKRIYLLIILITLNKGYSNIYRYIYINNCHRQLILTLWIKKV